MPKYSVLCQSPVSDGMSHAEAVNNTVKLAIETEKLGYSRFWVSEHHSAKAFASASPEVMVPRLASVTDRMRIGSGGVLVGHYSPYKIAEQFNLLSALFPGRIDMGLGRAPGGEPRVVKALESQPASVDAFGKMDEVLSYCRNEIGRPVRNVSAHPLVGATAEPWILGTSNDSAIYAASRGLPYCFGAFIGPDAMDSAIRIYYENFRPSEICSKPRLAISVFAICSESGEKAKYIAGSSELWFVNTFIRRQGAEFPHPDLAVNEKYAYHEEAFLEQRRRASIVGGPDYVKSRLDELNKKYSPEEIFLVTITHDFADRLESYRLIIEY